MDHANQTEILGKGTVYKAIDRVYENKNEYFSALVTTSRPEGLRKGKFWATMHLATCCLDVGCNHPS